MNDLPLAKWRLLQTPPASGVWNMAVDEAILEATIAKVQLPTLRLYAWAPPTLSIGYAQPFDDIDPSRLAELGWEAVRRPTGGRAILHTDELTYSVIGPQDEPRLAGGVLESYRRLAQALLIAFHRLELPAKSQDLKTDHNPSQEIDPVCFDVPSNYEIVVNGKKLVGSAQSRKQGGVLQHGTLPLFGDLTRITQVLRYSDETARATAAARLLTHATTVEMSLGKVVSWDEAAEVLVAAFSKALNVSFQPQALSPQEETRAEELIASKYDTSEWLQKH